MLIGSGPHAARVQRNLTTAQLGERFHWLSAVPGAASAFSELDLYVLPSRFEGGPYTPLEAMRADPPHTRGSNSIPGNWSAISAAIQTNNRARSCRGNDATDQRSEPEA